MREQEASASELFVTFLSWARTANVKRLAMVVAPTDDEERASTGVLSGIESLGQMRQ
jgi:hypothetical protein